MLGEGPQNSATSAVAVYWFVSGSVTHLYGPAAIGAVNHSSSDVTWSIFEMPECQEAMARGHVGNGMAVVISRVWSSITTRPSASVTSPARSSSQPAMSPRDRLAPPQATMFSGFAPCSQYALKSAAVMGVPSWKTASSRNLTVQTVSSSLTVWLIPMYGRSTPNLSIW